jgi:hypothetical protein
MRVRLDEIHLENQMMQDIYDGMLTDEDRVNGLTWEDMQREDILASARDEVDYECYDESYSEPAPTFWQIVEDVQESLDDCLLDAILLVSLDSELRLLVRDHEGWFYTVALEYEEGSSGSYWDPSWAGYWMLDEC